MVSKIKQTKGEGWSASWPFFFFSFFSPGWAFNSDVEDFVGLMSGMVLKVLLRVIKEGMLRVIKEGKKKLEGWSKNEITEEVGAFLAQMLPHLTS